MSTWRTVLSEGANTWQILTVAAEKLSDAEIDSIFAVIKPQ